jgi:hypothetical protein
MDERMSEWIKKPVSEREDCYVVVVMRGDELVSVQFHETEREVRRYAAFGANGNPGRRYIGAKIIGEAAGHEIRDVCDGWIDRLARGEGCA